MIPEAQRIAIAERCGWTHVFHGSFSGILTGYDPKDGKERTPPNYLNDLNAMFEAEKSLTIDQKYDYGEALRVISQNVGPKGGHFLPNGFGCYALAHLTATQRAEAFLRTLGLWTA